MKGNWNYPTKVRFGAGRISELADACKEFGIRRPLFVTDRGLAGTDMVKSAIAANESAGVPTGLFTDVQPNPVWSNVENGLRAYRDGGHDGVIAFGGGSPLDVGKSIAFMLPQSRPIWDFEDVGDNYRLATGEGVAPVIAIPTTAGTGSEVGRGAVITNEASHTKKIIFHPSMMPVLALLDAELTVGMSPKMTAGTGMDALSHNLEAYCAPSYHPMAEGIAVEGVRLVKEWLPAAYTNGHDLEARGHMLAAAAMGATAFQKGLGAIHALSHPVGAIYDTHHGLTNAVFLPYVLAFNRSAIEGKIARLAAYLGLPNPSFDSFLQWTLDLRSTTGIPHTLAELGVDESRLDEMSVMAEVDPPAQGNPVPVKAKELRLIYGKAMTGDVR
ncbi:MAG TPA: iron-containing alcohol dehydrogenase [Fimbriimonadaceae bacterium]|nr:iron-containing alcohol dehydrogenase [Fimbriimonadaceae bacterium]